MPQKRRSFGKVVKMRSGRYQASYMMNGERFNAPDTFGSKADADAWLSDVRTSINRNEWVDPRLAGQTFRVYALTWLKGHKDNLAPGTARMYAELLDQLLLPLLGALPMNDITPLVVKQWWAKIAEMFEARAKAGKMPNKRSTGKTRASQAYRLLHTIMAEGVRDEVIRHNPCVIKGAARVKATERKPATLEELDTIAANMPERYRALIHVAAWSGLRFGELAGLRRADAVLVVDGSGVICYRLNVDKQAYRLGGKLYEEALPKTDAGRRVVYLPAHLTDLLTAHMEKFTGADNAAYVFGTRNGTPMTSSTVGKMFRRARVIAGRPDMRFHDLRHTGATLAAKAGATTKELMRRMGHSSMRAALIYQHAAEEDDLRLVARMDAMAAGLGVGSAPAVAVRVKGGESL
ncbi:tyrosine-type recombinase/integrase [Bifidobacterium miconisargentati]|uniref:tyrosine-type recombinase/integrase n=1 Tax=Bifidobacterium miconisargentati TaxID=2834437 RepID=UPI001BDC78AA|nr:site-specific integrase [Bifidobacterium miconisargentati]MBW3091085.1 site-specific integrase [Bifidobacterium miconisargentati]